MKTALHQNDSERKGARSRLFGFVAPAMAALCVLAVPVRAATETISTSAVIATNTVKPAVANRTPGRNTAGTMIGATTRIDMAALKFINDRNVFNAYRQPGVTNGAGPKIIIRAENFDLTGTISYEKVTVAFFSGSQPEYSKVLKVQGTIAGYKVTEIGHNSVKLEAGGQQFEMKVGMRMKRENLGPWSMIASTEGSMYVSGDNRGDRSNLDSGGGRRNNFNNQDNGGRRQRGSGGGNVNGPNSLSEPTSSPPVTAGPPPSKAEVDAVLQKLQQDREKEIK